MACFVKTMPIPISGRITTSTTERTVTPAASPPPPAESPREPRVEGVEDDVENSRDRDRREEGLEHLPAEIEGKGERAEDEQPPRAIVLVVDDPVSGNHR